jgi:hypothetical protein
MQNELEKNLIKPRKRFFFFFMLVNIIIFLKYFLYSSWVLLEVRQEVLTGLSYDWSARVKIHSVALMVVSAVFLGSAFFARSKNLLLKKILLGCIFFFFLSELYEALMLHIHYGPIKASDFMVYIPSLLMLIWAVFVWRFLFSTWKY